MTSHSFPRRHTNQGFEIRADSPTSGFHSFAARRSRLGDRWSSEDMPLRVSFDHLHQTGKCCQVSPNNVEPNKKVKTHFVDQCDSGELQRAFFPNGRSRYWLIHGGFRQLADQRRSLPL